MSVKIEMATDTIGKLVGAKDFITNMRKVDDGLVEEMVRAGQTTSKVGKINNRIHKSTNIIEQVDEHMNKFLEVIKIQQMNLEKMHMRNATMFERNNQEMIEKVKIVEQEKEKNMVMRSNIAMIAVVVLIVLVGFCASKYITALKVYRATSTMVNTQKFLRLMGAITTVVIGSVTNLFRFV